MSHPIIRVENLGKKYVLSHQQEGRGQYKALRDVIADGAKSLGRQLLKPSGKKISNSTREEFWALKDVSFEIHQGDRVGIVGRNGAGKSTLLKVLSRITEPTKGSIRIQGRVASLLEVGTGFHPELTGRENIYLNGAILGMGQAEIKRKFDEIVDFAEVERFLDTPVKRYSSGMYVRLAFAVAAHLEPEILIVDEVLAVGDAQFQKKCMSKMQDVGEEGRTVLFVSHNMQAVYNLCTKGVLLNKGCVESVGSPKEIIGKYLSAQPENISGDLGIEKHTKSFTIKQISCFGELTSQPIYPLKELTVEIDIKPRSSTRDISVHILVKSYEDSTCYLGYDSFDFNAVADNIKIDTTARFTLRLPSNPLPPGQYYIDLYIKSYSNQTFEKLEQAATFVVSEQPVYGSRLYDERWHGKCLSMATITVTEAHV